mmetsp:Transcript_20494/g.55948  ORF Transcript_20494/g.55948 Transcript_20494/m.55948 type:complete len:88 (-) Transcript_20494:306-569(-)
MTGPIGETSPLNATGVSVLAKAEESIAVNGASQAMPPLEFSRSALFMSSRTDALRRKDGAAERGACEGGAGTCDRGAPNRYLYACLA